MAGAGVLGRMKQAVRPRVAQTAQNLVDPAYARREELASAVTEIQRLMADQMASEEEATATFGRVLAQLSAQLDALQAEVARLATLVEQGGRKR
jgi:ubiquinone biosynthesis protein UbiJ